MESVQIRTKPGLVKDPLAQAAGPDKTLWSVWEIQLFLEKYLLHPKDFARMSIYFPHKTVSQLIQFYFDFKWVFELKKYGLRSVIKLYRNYWRLMSVKKDRRVSLHDLARELSKRLLLDKLPCLSNESRNKSLFTIAEIKALARGQHGRPTELHKEQVQSWAFDYQRQVSEIEKSRESIHVNTDYFNEAYVSAYSKIASLFGACASTQTCLDKLLPGSLKPSLKGLENIIEIKKRSRPETESIKFEIRTERFAAKSRGTHWEFQEKERFFKLFKVMGKDWKGLRTKFPNKTDKQLRNFYQNNKVRFLANGGSSHVNW